MRKATLGHIIKHLNTTSQVIVRTDFNVPVKDGKVTDINRIQCKHLNIKPQFQH